MDAPHPAGWALGMALILAGIATVALAPALSPFAIVAALLGAATLCATFTIAATGTRSRSVAAKRHAFPVAQDVQIVQALHPGETPRQRPTARAARLPTAQTAVAAAASPALAAEPETGPVLVIPLPRIRRAPRPVFDAGVEAGVDKAIREHAAPVPRQRTHGTRRATQRPKRVRTGHRSRPMRATGTRKMEKRIRAR